MARRIAADIGIELFDDNTYEANRMMFWPAVSCDGEYILEVIEGQPLEPNTVLSRYKNWRNTEEWPVSARQDPVVLRQAAKVADPLTKDGAVGLICRAYYPNIAASGRASLGYLRVSQRGGRDTYTKGCTPGGLFAYTDIRLPRKRLIEKSAHYIGYRLFPSEDDRGQITLSVYILPFITCRFRIRAL